MGLQMQMVEVKEGIQVSDGVLRGCIMLGYRMASLADSQDQVLLCFCILEVAAVPLIED